MTTLTISRRQRAVSALLRRARKGGVILRSPDGREFVLAEIDDFDREIELTRKNERLMKLLDERAKQTRTIPLAEVAARVGSRVRRLVLCQHRADG
ncbi:MAG: hypothetical protein FJ290_06495 [Planctomycetes bacterium]|nr:hypothetical protein [Planctomycetota bacterium]